MFLPLTHALHPPPPPTHRFPWDFLLSLPWMGIRAGRWEGGRRKIDVRILGAVRNAQRGSVAGAHGVWLDWTPPTTTPPPRPGEWSSWRYSRVVASLEGISGTESIEQPGSWFWKPARSPRLGSSPL